MSVTIVQPEPATIRDDDGPAILTMSAEFDGHPVKVTVEYEDAVSVLKMLHGLGTEQSLYSLAVTLSGDEGEDGDED
ncbi:hypothetical protein [Rhodococcus sp. NPDC060176]|uniref:hypothetical protein n=1 Tax=Rhodococcus sp. NPDC060176 TaxID=3347062 RepID=UPI0036595884